MNRYVYVTLAQTDPTAMHAMIDKWAVQGFTVHTFTVTLIQTASPSEAAVFQFIALMEGPR